MLMEISEPGFSIHAFQYDREIQFYSQCTVIETTFTSYDGQPVMNFNKFTKIRSSRVLQLSSDEMLKNIEIEHYVKVETHQIYQCMEIFYRLTLPKIFPDFISFVRGCFCTIYNKIAVLASETSNLVAKVTHKNRNTIFVLVDVMFRDNYSSLNFTDFLVSDETCRVDKLFFAYVDLHQKQLIEMTSRDDTEENFEVL